MQGEILTIGSDLLSGAVLDTNGWVVAGMLTASGLTVSRITTLGDDPEEVTRALEQALCASGFVIITVGTGSPLADGIGGRLHPDKKWFEPVRRCLEAVGSERSFTSEESGWLPAGGENLDPDGTFRGITLVVNGVRLYFLPGVPDQMHHLMGAFVIPRILSHTKKAPPSRRRILKLYGLTAPEIAEKLTLSKKMEGVVLGLVPRFPEHLVTISLSGHPEVVLRERLNRVEEEIRSRVGPCVFATGVRSMGEVVGELLMKKGNTLSVAESCTGGLIGNLLTDVAGSSGYFLGGAVVYSNRSKIDILQVSRHTLENHGAVSDETAREMSEGVRNRLNTDLGLAVTGIAGPDGGSEDKPVGTVHVSLSTEKKTFSKKYHFRGTRRQIKSNTAMMAMDWVRRYLDGNPFLPGL